MNEWSYTSAPPYAFLTWTGTALSNFTQCYLWKQYVVILFHILIYVFYRLKHNICLSTHWWTNSYINWYFINALIYIYIFFVLDGKIHILATTQRDGPYEKSYTKGKSVPLQAWSGPEGPKKLRFPDFVTMAQDGGRLSALRTGQLYP